MAHRGGAHSRQGEEQAEMPGARNKLVVFQGNSKKASTPGGEKPARVVGDEME